MNSLALKCVQICGKSGNKRFTFTGLHFGYPALVQDYTAYYLYAEMLHPENSPRSLAANGISVRQNIVQRFPFSKPAFKYLSLGNKFFIAHRLVFAFKSKNFISRFGNALNFLC